jgi:hypothetical protein
MWEAADSIIYSVAQELGMKHREWIIMVASEQSKILQARNFTFLFTCARTQTS